MNGKHVVITGGAGALGSAVRKLFEEKGATLHVPPLELVDLSDEVAVAKYYGELPPLWASIHIAGGFQPGAIENTTLADVRRQLDMNFVTAFLCCREAVKKPVSRIVNVASRAPLQPSGGSIAYTASKAAVVSLTQALAEEVKERGILVNAVAPSIMDTAANRRSMPDADFAKWPKTEDVARTIYWLSSDENVLTSGCVMPVYGRT